jgi:hypothetical protein
MIPAFERAKTLHALDRAATVIGFSQQLIHKSNSWQGNDSSHGDDSVHAMIVSGLMITGIVTTNRQNHHDDNTRIEQFRG